MGSSMSEQKSTRDKTMRLDVRGEAWSEVRVTLADLVKWALNNKVPFHRVLFYTTPYEPGYDSEYEDDELLNGSYPVAVINDGPDY
jgi:hypothetical protein